MDQALRVCGASGRCPQQLVHPRWRVYCTPCAWHEGSLSVHYLCLYIQISKIKPNIELSVARPAAPLHALLALFIRHRSASRGQLSILNAYVSQVVYIL